LQEIETLRAEGIYTGFEVEMMADGRLTLDPRFRDRLDVLIGSVHFMPGLEGGAEAAAEVLPAWWTHTERLMHSGIDVLGHPFRWLARNAKIGVTEEMIRRLVRLAAEAKVALELNSHMRIPGDVLLLRECLEAGVPVTLASDSHSREEIGNLEYPLAVVAAAGVELDQVPQWLPGRFRPRCAGETGSRPAAGGLRAPDNSP
jgi:histidinol phosphatase-like PHP family hydrolase